MCNASDCQWCICIIDSSSICPIIYRTNQYITKKNYERLGPINTIHIVKYVVWTIKIGKPDDHTSNLFILCSLLFNRSHFLKQNRVTKCIINKKKEKYLSDSMVLKKKWCKPSQTKCQNEFNLLKTVNRHYGKRNSIISSYLGSSLRKRQPAHWEEKPHPHHLIVNSIQITAQDIFGNENTRPLITIKRT